MRAARKQLGLTQQSVCGRLGLSQAAWSKMEHGLAIPSAPKWFQFCEIAGISPDCLTTGYIERSRPAVLEGKNFEHGFRMPKRYADFRGSKTRAMLPFLLYFKSVLGEEKLGEYFDSIKLDPDLFVDLDNQINLNFCLDISRHLIRSGDLKSGDIPKLARIVTQPQAHGSLHRHYEGSLNVPNLINILILNSRQYECNFSYQVEDQNREVTVVSVTPEKHLKEFEYKHDDNLGNFLCRYKQHYFEQFTTYGGLRGAKLQELQCHYQGHDRCVYELRTA